MKSWFEKNALFLSFAVALIATVGSLFFSEVLKYTPCTLCWYQRIFIYPLVIILPIAILNKDTLIYRYILPLVYTGGVIALYHTFISFGLVKDTLTACSAGVSCADRYINWLGFIDIPLLSLLMYILLIILMKISKKGANANESGS